VDSKITVLLLLLMFTIPAALATQTIYYTANSEINVHYPPDWDKVYVTNAEPGHVCWTLKNPNGDIVYQQDVGFSLPHGSKWYENDGWHSWQEYTIRIPAFPQEGTWKLEAQMYGGPWEKIPMGDCIVYKIPVRQGNLIDNLMAPIYLHAELAPLGLANINLQLPGIFWLTSPLWLAIAIIIIVKIWKGSLKAGIKILKKGGKKA